MIEDVEKEYGVYAIGGGLVDVLDHLFPSYEEALEHCKTMTDVQTVVVGVVCDKEEN